jgi:ABC-2 type transport system ATP-binding protein
MSALQFKSVQKNYGDFTALKNISFDVKQGEFFALLGQNGAGKTTLINCLGGALNRSGGEILVLGEDPEKNPSFTKNHLGIVEQEISFDPFLSPRETLETVRGFFGLPQDDEYMDWLLKKLSLLEKKDTRARGLSGGMKRRLMIAKALIHKPKILILDEPTAGVDVDLRKSLWKFIKELQSEHNITILLTTHYLEEAQELAERIAIIHNGEIVVCKPTDEILKGKKRILEVFCKGGKTKKFEIENDSDIIKNIQTCSGIENIKIEEPKLEDIFLEYTK